MHVPRAVPVVGCAPPTVSACPRLLSYCCCCWSAFGLLSLHLPVPHAPKLVAHLVQHLVHGSVLSSDFFDTLPEDVAAAMAEGGAARKAAALYKSDHVGCDDTDEVGGAGAVAPVDALKHAVFTIANEYLKDGYVVAELWMPRRTKSPPSALCTTGSAKRQKHKLCA